MLRHKRLRASCNLRDRLMSLTLEADAVAGGQIRLHRFGAVNCLSNIGSHRRPCLN